MPEGEKSSNGDYTDKYREHNIGVFSKGYRCSICHKKIDESNLIISNIIPKEKFGPSHVINCISICGDCESKYDNNDKKIIFKKVYWKAIEELLIFIKLCFSKITFHVSDKVLPALFSKLSEILSYRLYDIKFKRFSFSVKVIHLLILIILFLILGGGVC